MCGFVAIYDSLARRTVSLPTIRKMCDLIEHRGPDHFGQYEGAHLAIGFRRLSIIDLSAEANQPMVKGDLVISFNGEIYNYRELRKELEAEGVFFKTQSDTEVILEAYKKWGVDSLRRFNGMFSLLLWNRSTKSLFVARDRLGVKPLFYARHNGRHLFASDIKSLWELMPPANHLNTAALKSFFGHSYVNDDQTPTAGVERFPAAHSLVIENGQEKWERYWDLNNAASSPLSFEEAVEKTETILEEAVGIRLRSDVPLGCFLSGGVDSSLITALTSKKLDRRFHTYSIGFDEARSDESPYAKRVSEQYGTDHHHLQLNQSCLEELPKIVWYYSEPFGDASAVPTWFVSREARRNLTVVLTGDGGDEAFGGYVDPFTVYLGQGYRRLPVFLRRGLAGLSGLTRLERWGAIGRRFRRFNELSFASPEEIAIALKDGSWGSTPGIFSQNGYDHRSSILKHLRSCRSDDSVRRLLYADIQDRLSHDFLVKVDMGTMAHSLEARSPFLDYRLMELGYSLRHSVRYHRWQRKAVLKTIARKYIDRDIVDRRKMGFSIPQAKWLRQWWPTVRKIIDRSSSLDNFIGRKRLSPVFAEFEKGRGDHANRIWLLLWYQIWDGLFISGVFRADQKLSEIVR